MINTNTRIKRTAPLPLQFRAFCIVHKTPILCERRDVGEKPEDEIFYCPKCKCIVDVDWWTLVAYPKNEKEKKENKIDEEEHRKLPPEWLDVKL
jgi:hypothetical protein